MERKVLGRGLSALIPPAQKKREEATAGEIAYLKTGEIKLNPYQPRKEFVQETLKELAASIKEKGLIQPIVVRRLATGEYELIAGERRLRAVKVLNIEEIPALIKEAPDQDSLELSLIENIQRESLNPIDEARAYQMLMEKFSLTQERISQMIGKARTTVANVLRLLKLPPEIQEELKRGSLSFAHARTLLEIEDPHLQRDVFKNVVSNSLSVRELENLIRQKLPKKFKRKSHFVEKDPYKTDLEDKLKNRLGTKVRIINHKKRGKIEIEYYSPTDLERILKAILK